MEPLTNPNNPEIPNPEENEEIWETVNPIICTLKTKPMAKNKTTFGELSIGDKFICRPRHKESGFFLFEKIESNLFNNAKRCVDGIFSKMPDDMRVVQILTK